MSVDRKINFSWPEFPKGEEGVAKVIELVNNAMFSTNPSFESNADHLITNSSQINNLLPHELNAKIVKTLEERIIFSLFQRLGIPDETLRRIYFPGERINLIHCEHDQPQPQLYINQSLTDGLDIEDRNKRVLAALKLGGLLIETNFNLLVEPADVPDNLRQGAGRIIRRYLYGDLLMGMASTFGDQVDPIAFEAVAGIVNSIENRLVMNGGMLCLVLPHQTVDTAEVSIGEDSHSDLTLYFAKPTIEKFMASVKKAGFTKGVRITLPLEVRTASDRIVRFAALNNNTLDNMYESFRKSQLPLVLI